VWAHRRPAETYGSTLELAACCNQGVLGHVDRPALGAVMLDAVRTGLDHVLGSNVADDPRLIHLRYTDLVADPIGCVRTVYERGGRPFPAGYEQRMRSWLDDPTNTGHRHGRFHYDLKDFGLTDEGVDQRFADYIERFLTPNSTGATA
jgi:hypothetical protein